MVRKEKFQRVRICLGTKHHFKLSLMITLTMIILTLLFVILKETAKESVAPSSSKVPEGLQL